MLVLVGFGIAAAYSFRAVGITLASAICLHLLLSKQRRWLVLLIPVIAVGFLPAAMLQSSSTPVSAEYQVLLVPPQVGCSSAR